MPTYFPDPDAQLYHCGHPLGSSEFALLTDAHEMCLHGCVIIPRVVLLFSPHLAQAKTNRRFL